MGACAEAVGPDPGREVGLLFLRMVSAVEEEALGEEEAVVAGPGREVTGAVKRGQVGIHFAKQNEALRREKGWLFILI